MRPRQLPTASVVFFLFTFCSLSFLSAAPPLWWSQRGILNTNSANDYAALNQGQLKNLAKQAAAELNAKLPGGAGSAVNNLVNSWSATPAAGSNYNAVNQGQLKTVARVFYDRLIETGYRPAYPWTAVTTDDNSFAAANIGQAKYLFSFVLAPLAATVPTPLAPPAPLPPRTLPPMPQPIIGGSTGPLVVANGTPPPPSTPSSSARISPGAVHSDGSPVPYPSSGNGIVGNGDFSTPTINHNTPPGDYGLYYGQASPWQAVSGSILELQDRSDKYDGQYLELDSNWASSDHSGSSDHGIQQSISLGKGGYRLTFNYRHRNDDSSPTSTNGIKVTLDPGSRPVTLAAISVTASDWKSCQVSFEVSAATSAILTFDINDPADSLGAYVDCIFVEATASSGEYTVPFSEASGSRYRKIGLNGRPLPDEKPQQSAESDEEKEETYIDALDLSLHHSVTDVYVPIAGSDLALTVRRNTQSEVWNMRSGLRPAERVDRPFGTGWSSNLEGSLHVVYDNFVTYYYVTDQNGAQHRFLYLNGLYVPMPSDTRENGDYLTTLAVQTDGSFVFKDRYGTATTFVYARYLAILKSRDADADPTQVEYDYYYRVQKIADRLGNTLIYEYEPNTASIIPSRISLQDHSDQSISIISTNGIVSSVTDPNGKEYRYGYVAGPGSSNTTVLNTVTNPKQEITSYGYDFAFEPDLTPANLSEGRPVDQYHLDVQSIKDPRLNTWSFSYQVDHTKEDFNTGTGYYPQTGAPRNVIGVTLPDGRQTKLDNSQSLVAVDLTPALIPGSQRKTVVTDAHFLNSSDPEEQGHIINYTFGQGQVLKVAGLYQDTPAWAVPKVVFYTSMVIEYPGVGSETFTFDATAGLALKSVLDLSGNTTRYTYGDAYAPPGLSTAFPSGLFGYYEDPTVQTNARNRDKTFHYSSNYRIMDQVVDEEGRTTTYVVDDKGRRTEEKVYNKPVGGSAAVLVQDTVYEFTDVRFPGVVTKKTVKKLNDPTWSVDLVTTYDLDSAGRVARETVVKPNAQNHATEDLITTFIYDANGNKLTATDPLTHTTWFDYDFCNRLKRVTYFDGSYKDYDYDPRGNKTRETDENGYSTIYAYDALNRPTDQARDMDGNLQIERGTSQSPLDLVTSYTYNAVGSRKTQTDPNGNTTTYAYDDLQRLSSTTTPAVAEAPNGYTTTYEYDLTLNAGASAFDSSAFQPTLITAPPLRPGRPAFRTKFVYDNLYRPTTKSVEYKVGVFADTTTGYDEAGNPTSVQDDLHHTTFTTYDGLNRPLRTTYPDNYYTENSYTATGLKWQVEDELHRKSETRYDWAGRPEFVLQPAVFDPATNAYQQPVTQTIYDKAGNIKATINPLLQRWDYDYDVRNRKISEQQPAVADATNAADPSALVRPTITTGYDYASNVSYVTDARGYTTETLYDQANRPDQITAPPVPIYGQASMRPMTSKSYDRDGNVLTATDANIHTTTNTYDALNRLKTTEDAKHILVQNDYDSAGNLIKVTDGRLQSTLFDFDGLNRNISSTDLANRTTSFGYNGVNKTDRSDALSQTTTYGYDLRNRLETITYTARAADNRKYIYDAHGNLKTVQAGNPLSSTNPASAGYDYDAVYRMTSETSSGITHSYAYDLAGNRLTATYGGTGRVLTSIYDNLNRLSTLAESGRSTGYGYDLNGNTVRKTLPNAEVVTTSYDGLNRAQAILGKKPNGTLSYQYLNGYDRGGNVRWVDEFYNDRPAWRDIVMDYDNADRLLHEVVAEQTGNTRTTTYGYDDAHNRTSTTVANSSGGALVTSTFGFNNLNQLTSYTETGGSVTRNVTYGYDFAGNRKTRVENGATDSYGYDYEQRLVSLGKNTAGGTGAYAYSYDYRTRRVGRTEGSAVTQTVFSGGTSVQEYNGTSTTPAPASLKAEYVRGSDWGGGVGGVLYSLRSSVPSYNHYDRRGDVTEKTSSAGATTYQASYQPFGLHPNDFGSTLDRQKANTKEEDPTGLLNEGMRYRDLETGMFITRDPMGFVDGPNLYTYVRQNPWTSFDPNGLSTKLNLDGSTEFDDHPTPSYQQAREDESAKIETSAKLQNDLNWKMFPKEMKEDQFIHGLEGMKPGVALGNAIRKEYGSLTSSDIPYDRIRGETGSFLSEGVINYGKFFEAATPIVATAFLPIEGALLGRSTGGIAAEGAVNAGASLPAREVGNFIGQAQRSVIGEGEVLYGIRDAGSRNLWWTRTQPAGELQWRMDQAVLPQWNKGTHIETLTVPKGQSIIGFEGPARGQGPYLGGGNQIYVPGVPSGWSSSSPWP